MNIIRKTAAEDAHELEVLNKLMHFMVGTYALGWGILVLYTRDVPLLEDYIWRIAAGIVFILTIWLAASLSLRALVWWSSFTAIVATFRSAAYLSDGFVSAFGVWMLVLSGIGVTTLAIISVQALTGRLPLRES